MLRVHQRVHLASLIFCAYCIYFIKSTNRAFGPCARSTCLFHHLCIQILSRQRLNPVNPKRFHAMNCAWGEVSQERPYFDFDVSHPDVVPRIGFAFIAVLYFYRPNCFKGSGFLTVEDIGRWPRCKTAWNISDPCSIFWLVFDKNLMGNDMPLRSRETVTIIA